MESKPESVEYDHVDTGDSITPTNESVTSSGIAEKDHGISDTTHVENGSSEGLSQEHRDYLIARHGTIDLDPLPTMDTADPLNWPAWKKNTNLLLVSFHAMITTFTAAAVIPVYESFSLEFGISITSASYLTSTQILILGFSPLFWKPISNRFGRRPIWLISTFCSMICNIGCAESHSYASQVVTRLLVAFFISPAIAISGAVVTETFFARERGQKMGIWTLMVTLGPPAGPFIMGFVAFHTGNWQWIYYVLAITNAVQFILYFHLSPETLHVRSGRTLSTSSPSFRRQYLNFGILGPLPLTARDFWTPIRMFAYPSVLLPTIAYSVVFNFTSVLLTVEIPQLFTTKFRFNAQQIGLQFIGMIIGSVLGEQLGGMGSDLWIECKSIRWGRSRKPSPEHRIWVAYPGFVTAIFGLVVFCVQMERIQTYNVTPIVGIAIAAFGNQVITTVLVTYAVDCHQEHAASIGVFINLIRSTWGFLGPFWFPSMFTSLGLDGSAGLMAGIIVVFAILPMVFIQWKGEAIREKIADIDLEQLDHNEAI